MGWKPPGVRRPPARHSTPSPVASIVAARTLAGRRDAVNRDGDRRAQAGLDRTFVRPPPCDRLLLAESLMRGVMKPVGRGLPGERARYASDRGRSLRMGRRHL